MIGPDDIVRFAIGWSRTRGVTAPVAEGPVLRVEVGLPDQTRRFIFPYAPMSIADIGARVDEPFVLLKAPIDVAAVRPLLSSRWLVERTGTMMTLDTLPPKPATLPAGYSISLSDNNGVVTADIADNQGKIAAHGLMTIIDHLALHDQIRVDEGHRRRGLGRAIVSSLGVAAAQRGAQSGILTATIMGRALYVTLGWKARSPWTTAQIPPITT